jgi:DNA-binding transcriptional LysR family regulator
MCSRSVKRLVKKFPVDLAKTSMLLRPAGNPVRNQVEQFLSRRKVSVRVGADSDDVGLLLRLAMSGQGVAVLSAVSAAADIKAGRLMRLHASPVGIVEPVWLVTSARPRANPALRRLIDAVMKGFSLTAGSR